MKDAEKALREKSIELASIDDMFKSANETSAAARSTDEARKEFNTRPERDRAEHASKIEELRRELEAQTEVAKAESERARAAAEAADAAGKGRVHRKVRRRERSPGLGGAEELDAATGRATTGGSAEVANRELERARKDFPLRHGAEAAKGGARDAEREKDRAMKDRWMAQGASALAAEAETAAAERAGRRRRSRRDGGA